MGMPDGNLVIAMMAGASCVIYDWQQNDAEHGIVGQTHRTRRQRACAPCTVSSARPKQVADRRDQYSSALDYIWRPCLRKRKFRSALVGACSFRAGCNIHNPPLL